ncbi:MAG: methyltransferase [Vicinamibacterales bacterium]
MNLFAMLARRRVTLGFVLGAPVLWLAQPTGATLVAGVAMASVGEALRIWAAGHLTKAQEVTTSGPYRWIAHPLYLGSSVIGLGLAIASASAIVASLIAAYLLTTLTASIRSEQAFLQRALGESGSQGNQYGASGAAGSGGRRFSLERVIANHEHRALLGVIAAVLLLALKATYNGWLWR